MPILYTPSETPPVVIPPTPPRPYQPLPVRSVVPLEITWTGANGVVWYLTRAGSPVRLLPGIRGLEAVAPERWLSDAPGLAGNRYRGSTVGAREVFLPLYVYGTSSSDWLDVRRAWDDSLSEDNEGILTVMSVGQTRTLPCRWVRTEQGWNNDPLAAGRSKVGEYLEAAGSYWQGTPISRSWYDANEQDFFMTSSAGVFFITRSNKVSTAKIDNPGDVPVWPVWTVTGPFTTAQVGLAGSVIEIPFALTAGQYLTIDTRPGNQSAVDHTGASRESDLGAATFAPIPANSDVTLTLLSSGIGVGYSVRAEIIPLYKRAWSL